MVESQPLQAADAAAPSSWWSIANRDAKFAPMGALSGSCLVATSDGGGGGPPRQMLVLALGENPPPRPASGFTSSDGVTWRPVQGPSLRRYAAACALGEAPGSGVGLFGGAGGGPLLDDFWHWTDGAWSAVPKSGPWPPARIYANLVNPGDGGLWLFGGLNPSPRYFRDLWVSHRGGAQWTRVSDNTRLPPRYSACAFGHMVDGRVRLWVGGGASDGHAKQDAWQYDGDDWNPLPQPEWSARFSANVAVVGRTVYLFGGQGAGGRDLSDMWAAPLDNLEHWTLVDPAIPPHATSWSTCAVLGGEVYVTAGALGNAVWRLRPPAALFEVGGVFGHAEYAGEGGVFSVRWEAGALPRAAYEVCLWDVENKVVANQVVSPGPGGPAPTTLDLDMDVWPPLPFPMVTLRVRLLIDSVVGPWSPEQRFPARGPRSDEDDWPNAAGPAPQ